MTITWDEANQIVAQMIYEESMTVDAHTQERMASVIFSHRDEAWDHHNQEWVKTGGEAQDETEELHRKLKATGDRCAVLEEELARMRATDQLVKDSQNLRHIVNKLDSLNVPTQVDGELLNLPVDRMSYLFKLMRKAREAAEEQADIFSLQVTELSVQLGTALSQRDLFSKNMAAALDAIEAVNDRLRTATACKCQMIEVRAGEFQLFQVIDCPVHRSTMEIVA